MTRKNLVTGVAIALSVAVVYLFFIYGNPFSVLNQDQAASALSGSQGQLIIQDEAAGNGTEAKVGDTLYVHYTGKLQNGTVFDTSIGSDPYKFVLGAGQVIPGWDQGLQGMKVGGKRLLIIPPDLAYGSQDYGPIPANSTLTFEVQLVDIK